MAVCILLGCLPTVRAETAINGFVLDINMPKLVDLTGERFGRLVVIKRAENLSGIKVQWLCLCDCGKYSTPQGGALKNGRATSCGCFRDEKHLVTMKKHGMSKFPEYTVWYQMLERCNNASHVHYRYYGGRGIKVCSRWTNFINFYKDMGNRPSDLFQLDRRDNDLGYTPENCHWVTRCANARNKRGTLKISFQGRIMPIAEVAEIVGLQYQTLRWRINHGILPEDGLFSINNLSHR